MKSRKIDIKTIDYNMRTELAEMVYMTVCNVYDRSNVSPEEFKSVLDSGLREDLLRRVKTFYSFIENICVDISDGDLLGLHIFMSR